jgi:hypothetical protein
MPRTGPTPPLISRPASGPARSEGLSSAPRADPWPRRGRWRAVRSTTGCRGAEARRDAPWPAAVRASWRYLGLPLEPRSPSRTSSASSVVPHGGDPGGARAPARPRAGSPTTGFQRRPKRLLEPREQVPARARACVRPADPPRSGRGSCRTTRQDHARPAARSRIDASRGRSGRRRTDARRVLSRSPLLCSCACYQHHRYLRTAHVARWHGSPMAVCQSDHPRRYGRTASGPPSCEPRGGSSPAVPDGRVARACAKLTSSPPSSSHSLSFTVCKASQNERVGTS